MSAPVAGGIDYVSLASGLVGGLALFLFGMELLTRAMRQLAGEALRAWLARMTANRLIGLAAGAVLTALIQSSSITTVLLVGFVSAGLMSVAQAVPIILGANIGTTVTAQILAFKPTALALPLLALNRWMPLVAADGVSTLNERLAMGVGAGIYEELVFRLVLLSLLVMIGVDLFRLDRTAVTVGAVVLSALAFAAHHHPPIGHEPFRWMPFLFRSIAGVYLAVVFWFRGYGPAAGCHAAYNVALTLLDSGAGG